MWAARWATLKKGYVKGQQADSGGAIAPPESAKEAAKKVDVHAKTVARAKAIRRKAAPEVVEAVESGKLTL